MKKMITLLVLILSTYTFAKDNTAMEKSLNTISSYESKVRKYNSELRASNKQLKVTTKNFMELNNEYSKLNSDYRQLAGEVQHLKFQNDQLIQELTKAGSYTPELAKKVESLKGRLPASVETRK
jgi:predicted  nucleic acid-binding Zn-ribbon protein